MAKPGGEWPPMRLIENTGSDLQSLKDRVDMLEGLLATLLRFLDKDQSGQLLEQLERHPTQLGAGQTPAFEQWRTYLEERADGLNLTHPPPFRRSITVDSDDDPP